MKPVHKIAKLSSVLLLLALPSGKAASAQTLSLRHGKYVLESEKCKDAPNAAILAWDGKGFSGAHSNQCTSNVSRRSDGKYDVSTSCAALGDGSPAPAADAANMILKPTSPIKFVLVSRKGSDLAYRWCSAR